MKNIYTLSMHEELVLPNMVVCMRVPGGWLYKYQNTQPVYVPMNKEYAPKTPKQTKIMLSFNEREDIFKAEIKKVAIDIGCRELEVLKGFFEYWSEKSVKGDKMKWELEKTFTVKKRLGTWLKNQNKFGQEDKSNTLKHFES